MALLLGALMIHGLKPGPLLITEHPEIFWGTVASMYVGNVMLLVLNLPLIGIWVQVLESSLPGALPADPALLLHRGLQHKHQRLRPLCDAHLRGAGLCAPQTEL